MEKETLSGESSLLNLLLAEGSILNLQADETVREPKVGDARCLQTDNAFVDMYPRTGHLNDTRHPNLSDARTVKAVDSSGTRHPNLGDTRIQADDTSGTRNSSVVWILQSEVSLRGIESSNQEFVSSYPLSNGTVSKESFNDTRSHLRTPTQQSMSLLFDLEETPSSNHYVHHHDEQPSLGIESRCRKLIVAVLVILALALLCVLILALA